VSPPKRKFPYSSINGSRDQTFTEDLQLASLYVLAEARRKENSLSAISKVFYPFQIRKRREGAVMIDMLGLNQTNFKYAVIPEINLFMKDLDSKCETPESFLEELKSKRDYFKAFSDQKVHQIKGLLSRYVRLGETKDLIDRAVEFDIGRDANVFKPILKEKDVSSIFKSLSSIKKEISEDENSLRKAKRRFLTIVDVARKVVKEEVTNIKDEGKRRKDRLEIGLKKKKDRLTKNLDQNVSRIRKKRGRETKPLRPERNKLKRKLTRLEKRIETLKKSGDSASVKEKENEQKEAMKLFERIDGEIKDIELKHNKEIEELRQKFNSELKVEEDKIKELQEETNAKIKVKNELELKIVGEAKNISGKIENLARKKQSRLKSLSKIWLSMEGDEVELYVPFYLFQYENKEFNHHPPISVSGSTGLLSRFRRMLADGLESKMNMLIRPQDLFIERYLAKGVKSLNSDRTLFANYLSNVEELNQFRSLSSIDMIMKGLLKMRRQGWISDSEYIKLQENLVEQLSLTTRL
jgi:hypothetical protein